MMKDILLIFCLLSIVNVCISLEIPKSARVSLKDLLFNHIVPSVGVGVTLSQLVTGMSPTVAGAAESKGQFEYQPALQGLDYGKPRTFYPDYKQVGDSGLQYKLVTEGDGRTAKDGDRVSVDWEGYTIGYYGRPFQTRNKVKGGAFDSTESDNFRWIVGSGTAIAALDQAIKLLKEGSIAQIIVPAELGYPAGDDKHEIVGPKPGTFSGLRALNFVLDNKNLIDKTLLINVKVVKVTDKGALKKEG